MLAVFVPLSASGVSEPLLASIDQVRAAIADWDLEQLVRATAAMNETDMTVAGPVTDVFWRDYWLGVAGFNAVLCFREFPGEVAGIGNDEKGLTRQARDGLRSALDVRPDDGECHAMLAVLQGLAISDQPWSALFKGPGLLREMKAAKRATPRSPRTAYLLGAAKYRMARDEADIREAVEWLLEADQLFQDEDQRAREPWEPNWGHAHTLLFLGEAYQSLEAWSEAEAFFGRALELNPRLEGARKGLEQCRIQTAGALS